MKQSFLPPKILRDGKLILQFIILAGGIYCFIVCFKENMTSLIPWVL